MAVSKLICPECETVLRPAKPVALGKRVKCPKCAAIFTAQGEDEDEVDAPPRPAKKKPAAQPKPFEQPKATGIHYETTTYGVIKEAEDREKDAKEDRGDELVQEFLKIAKSKDPRGPAQEAVSKPSNYMIFSGSAGAICYGLVLLFCIIVYLMPPPSVEDLDEDVKQRKKMRGLMAGQAVGAVAAFEDPFKPKEGEEAADGAAFLAKVAFISAMKWFFFILFCFLFLIGIAYCAFVIYGAVKIQSLESRTWGIVSSILIMIPVNGLGFMMVTLPLALMALSFLYNDEFVIACLFIAVLVIEVAWGISIGIWSIKTLVDPAVIAGFEYKEDQDEEEEDEVEDGLP